MGALERVSAAILAEVGMGRKKWEESSRREG